MAALIRHGSKLKYLWSNNSTIFINNNTGECVRNMGVRIKSRNKPRNKPPNKPARRYEYVAKALAARGFLRPVKPYEPKPDASKELDKFCKSHGLSTKDSTQLDPAKRFDILFAVGEAFNYHLPNSSIHEMQTVGDLRNFYGTPIDTTVPFEAMKKMDLPKNLHILYNYHRFHPDDDTKFGGKTAFPQSSTIVTGLKYKKKYKGHVQKQTFPN